MNLFKTMKWANYIVILILIFEILNLIKYQYKRSKMTNRMLRKRHYKNLSHLLWGVIPLIIVLSNIHDSGLDISIAAFLGLEVLFVLRTLRPTEVYDEGLYTPTGIIYWENVLGYKFNNHAESLLAIRINDKKTLNFDDQYYIVKMTDEEKRVYMSKLIEYGIEKEAS
ncbi:MAG: hypothetical protein JEZ08_04110 [Clostridiales bacterium]|nr:hypothetical protein [Clostridiales bacterium]